jgi:hypothetical protein
MNAPYNSKRSGPARHLPQARGSGEQGNTVITDCKPSASKLRTVHSEGGSGGTG